MRQTILSTLCCHWGNSEFMLHCLPVRYFDADILTLLISIRSMDLWNVFIYLSASSLLFHRGWTCCYRKKKTTKKEKLLQFFCKTFGRRATGSSDYKWFSLRILCRLFLVTAVQHQPVLEHILEYFMHTDVWLLLVTRSVICTPWIMCSSILLRETRRHTFLGFKTIFWHFWPKTDLM